MTCPDAENCRSMAQMRDRDPVDAALAAVAIRLADQQDYANRESGTLRDRFAMCALANAYTHSDMNPDRIAERAYQIADAMLGARK